MWTPLFIQTLTDAIGIGEVIETTLTGDVLAFPARKVEGKFSVSKFPIPKLYRFIVQQICCEELPSFRCENNVLVSCGRRTIY